MRAAALLIPLVLALSGAAYRAGDIPPNIAVRGDANGELHYFNDRAKAEHEQMMARSQPAKRQTADIKSDTYPVADNGAGVQPFRGGAQGGGRKKRQDEGIKSDTYPVSDDGSGPKPFVGGAQGGGRK